MAWYVYLIHFVASLFLANAVPHFVRGITGMPFPTPFSNPPGRGDSPPVLNVLWSAVNVLVAGLLLWFWPLPLPLQAGDALVMFVGFFVAAVALAATFSNRRSGRP